MNFDSSVDSQKLVIQSYYQAVWHWVEKIPYGKLATYGQIAQALVPPSSIDLDEYNGSAAQLVGSAMAACPESVPWHRVVNAQARVSSRADANRQQHLLEAEGLVFYNGKLDLASHQWNGPDAPANPKQQSLF